MRKLTILLLLISLGSTMSLLAKQIKGVVIGADDKETLISASVYVDPEDLRRIKGAPATIGVITDLDGRFTIEVPDQVSSLYCSYLGYKNTEIKLTQKPGSLYKVEMESTANQLEAIVVTGYQRIEKRKLTAAVSKVDMNDDIIGSSRSIDQALAGQIAGMTVTNTTGAPGAPAKIRIRGTSSLSGTQDPLWVLDGIPLEGTDIPKTADFKDINELQTSSIAGLNPSDIESITVLKDAAATAIYGARAANGVIVITTKSGQKGKTKISLSAKLSYMPRLSTDRLNLLNTDQKVDLELDLLRSPYVYRSNKGNVSQIITSMGELVNYKDGGWSALSPQAQQAITTLRGQYTDWNNILFQDAFNQEYSVSLSGGGDKVTYYTSLGFYDEKGNVRGVEANRLNVVAKTNYQINKMLRMGASIFANRRQNSTFLTDNDGFTNPVHYARRANPYQLVYDADGNYIYDTNVQGIGDSDLNFNIFEERQNTSYKKVDHSINSNIDLELKIIEGLRLYTQLGLQADFTTSEKIADQESYAMRKDRTRATASDANGKVYCFLPLGGVHKQTETTNTQLTWKLQAEYRASFKEQHEIEAMVGMEMRRTWYESLFSAGYGFDRKTLTVKPVLFPDAEKSKYFPLHQLSRVENAYLSAFATFSYTFKHRYTLGASLRFDGSDLFGVDLQYRYLPLYSVSGVWRIKGEPYMQEVDWVDNLAVRASYGLQGNIDKNTSPFVMGQYSTITMLPGYSEDMITVAAAPNDKLRWEKTSSVNAGFDFAVLNQAINLSFDYYYRLGSDLIAMRELPLETGFASTSVNWASMENQGVEVALTTRNISTSHFTWLMTVNVGYNANKVLREDIPANQTTPSREGYPVGAIFGYLYGGMDSEGYPLFINKSGDKVTAKEFFNLELSGPDVKTNLSAQEQRNLYSYLGSSEPLVSGGFINTFSLYNFELMINCNFNLGQLTRLQPSYLVTKYDRGLNTNRDILNRWTPTNTNSQLPGLLYERKDANGRDYRKEEYVGFNNYNYDSLFDYWVRRSDYMRVQSIRLSYRFPTSWTKALRLTSGSMALEGRNLLVVGADYTNYLDPETMGNPFSQPIPKQVTFSININF